MRTIQEVNKIIEELCASMASLFPQDQIEAILFGSYARGSAEPGSDIDVLILVDGIPSGHIGTELAGGGFGCGAFAGLWNRSVPNCRKPGIFQ